MSSVSNADPFAAPLRAASSLQRRFLLGAGLGGAAPHPRAGMGQRSRARPLRATRERGRTSPAPRSAHSCSWTSSLTDRERQAKCSRSRPPSSRRPAMGGARAASAEHRRHRRTRARATLRSRALAAGAPPTRGRSSSACLPSSTPPRSRSPRAHGFNAVTTRRAADFVQSDEALVAGGLAGRPRFGRARSTTRRSRRSRHLRRRRGQGRRHPPRRAVALLRCHSTRRGARQGRRRRPDRRRRLHQPHRPELRLAHARPLPHRDRSQPQPERRLLRACSSRARSVSSPPAPIAAGGG